MNTGHRNDRRSKPCADVQVDLSAMLDGELDSVRARRVLVHLEVCPDCMRFMEALKKQVDLHRESLRKAPRETLPAGGEEEVDLFSGEEVWAGLDEDPSSFLGRMLDEGKDRLSEIFYQIGRAYVILAVHPEFFRLLCKEPVPIPEYKLRGRSVMDGVSGGEPVPESARGGKDAGTWLEARHLLHGELEDKKGNLEKGRSFLELALSLRSPFPQASIMLGEAFYQQVDFEKARACFQRVLEECPPDSGPLDPVAKVPLRVFAEEHLGNLCLAEGKLEEALRWFRKVEASGAMRRHPNFSSAYGNLAYTHLLLGNFESAGDYIEKLYAEFPAMRKAYGQMFALKSNIQKVLRSNPQILERLRRCCPEWFGERAAGLKHGMELQFDFVAEDSRDSCSATQGPEGGVES